ncbi:MAG: hypothetical protein HEEMFOPI_01122 [Holosporales bacterium]
MPRQKNKRKHAIANALIAFSGILVVTIMVWPTVSEYFTLEDPEKLLNLMINGAHNCQYKGYAQNGDRYILKARQVRELPDDCYEVLCADVFVETPDKKSFQVTANEMIFEKNTNRANLKGYVTFKNSDHVLVKTETARVLMDQELIEGDDFVECTQNDSTISGIGFKLDYKTGKVVFKNRPKMTILK